MSKAMSKRNQQLKFKGSEFKRSLAYGGSLRKDKKKRHGRPLSTKHSMHLCLKSSQAVGQWSFRYGKNWKIIENLCQKYARKNGIRIQEIANSGNHLHLLMKISNRYAYLNFIRALTGAIAIKITQANKYKSLKKKFWDCRPFTRVVESLKGFLTAKDYVVLNQMEAVGVIPYQPQRLKTVDRTLLRSWHSTA